MDTLGSPPCGLFVVCKITDKTGVVWDFTPKELAAALGPIGFKYKLADASRVEISQKESGAE